MRIRTRTSEDQGQAIDLTPMLDVVFIMLIFFIVTATFIKLPGVDITKVDTKTSDPYKKVGILVAVSGNNEYWIDKKRVEGSGLKLNLTRMFNDNPKGGMVIQADNEADIESLARVADVAREIGISPVAISVEND
ncbi:MAG: biopolymer transporter ExbD [Cellvibrionales bacterium TMED148]|nr:biopolymer transporter ExbD [Porticoccaceae bacterium]RPG89696.1 MAG: biopolymer transporter ExbD [Cellvibrionales bacterium TMED148]|tara:strand:- start:247 stop:651 length:405 start_codon:yes stop_codon:yes gene_type:complete